MHSGEWSTTRDTGVQDIALDPLGVIHFTMLLSMQSSAASRPKQRFQTIIGGHPLLPPHAVGSLAHCVKVSLLGSGGLPAPGSGTNLRRARGRDPRLPGDGDPEPRYRYGCAGNRPLPMSWLRSRDAGSDCQLPVGCVRPCLALDPPQVVPCAFLFAGVPGRLLRAATGARAGGAQRTEARGQGLGPVASVLEEAAGSRLRHSPTSKRARASWTAESRVPLSLVLAWYAPADPCLAARAHG
jgi:hypothetical protein